MYNKLLVLVVMIVAILGMIFIVEQPVALQAHFLSPISPPATPTPPDLPVSPLPTPANSGPTGFPSAPGLEILSEVYGLEPADIYPGGAYYVPPEYRGRVFSSPEEVAALGLKFVDFVLVERRTQCAMADPRDLGKAQIVYESTLGVLVRTAVVVEFLEDQQSQICWGVPDALP